MYTRTEQETGPSVSDPPRLDKRLELSGTHKCPSRHVLLEVVQLKDMRWSSQSGGCRRYADQSRTSTGQCWRTVHASVREQLLPCVCVSVANNDLGRMTRASCVCCAVSAVVTTRTQTAHVRTSALSILGDIDESMFEREHVRCSRTHERQKYYASRIVNVDTRNCTNTAARGECVINVVRFKTNGRHVSVKQQKTTKECLCERVPNAICDTCAEILSACERFTIISALHRVEQLCLENDCTFTCKRAE